MKHKKGTPFFAAGLLLLLGALGLVSYNLWDERRAADAVDSTMAVLDEAVVPVAALTQEDLMDLTGEIRIPDYLLDPKMDMPALEVEDERYIGYIEIPVLELKLPVMESWSYPNLKVSPCRYAGSPYQDNLVVAAHNYPRHFGRIKELIEGDEVRFTDIDGNVFVYTVVEQEQLNPRPAKAMLEGDWDLTLFTCTIGGQARVTIRCERAE